MSSIHTPRFWIGIAAIVSASWITFRVLDADASPHSHTAADDIVTCQDIADPALAAMVHRFAQAAGAATAPGR